MRWFRVFSILFLLSCFSLSGSSAEAENLMSDRNDRYEELVFPNGVTADEGVDLECMSSGALLKAQHTWQDLITSEDCEEGGLPNTCCSYWEVRIEWGFTGPTISCQTGGEFQCQSDESCDEVREEDDDNNG
jgi:hypothetical protein